MSGARHGIRVAGLVAANTVCEAARGRAVSIGGLLAAALLLLAAVLRALDLGGDERQFLINCGYGMIWLFGSILAVVLPAGLFFSEIESRTALVILAKPVSRAVLLIGKLGGVSAVLGVFILALMLLLAALLFMHGAIRWETGPGGGATGLPMEFAAMALAGLLIWQYCTLVAAATLLVASFGRSLVYTVSVSFLVVLAGQLQPAAREAAHALNKTVWRGGAEVLATLVPNLRVFYIGDELASGVAIAPAHGAAILLYGVLYLGLFTGLAVWSFQHREL